MIKDLIKRFTTLIIATILISSGTRVFALSSDNEELKNQYAYTVGAAIVDFYENKDMGAANMLDSYIASDKLSEFLDAKSDLHRFVTDKASLQKENYSVRYDVLSETKLNSAVLIEAVAHVSFNYSDLTDVESGYSEAIQLIIVPTENGYKIQDWYTADNYYDMSTRGYDIDILNDYEKINELTDITEVYKDNDIIDYDYVRRVNSSDIINIDFINLETKQIELTDRLEDYFEIEYGNVIKPQPATIDEEDDRNVSATLYSLNKANIISWTLNNAKKLYPNACPTSGGSGVPYYDFTQISGAYDCTNFVSHALLAGGATINNNGNASTGWWYSSLNSRSYSWAGVPNLHDYLTTNRTKGPAGASFTYSVFDERQGYPYSTGDLLQHKNSAGTWRHSTIITGAYQYYASSRYYWGALVTGRAGATNNYNQKAEEIYAGYPKRVIKLNGNYR